jgi:hypothetical protein
LLLTPKACNGLAPVPLTSFTVHAEEVAGFVVKTSERDVLVALAGSWYSY